jgi:3-hydroxyacyl-CoA dehydrogenase / 3-hydroxy-2-methylbutyryl-CoA dehydrogenase
VNIEDTVAIVTGGASGLGEGVARMVTGAGGRTAILDLPRSKGSALAEELGDGAGFFPVDVTNPEQTQSAVDAAVAHFGAVTLLVSCAGVSRVHGVLDPRGEMFPLDVFRRTMEINVVGMFDVIRHAVRHMATNQPAEDGERGMIVNVASIAGIEGQAGQAAYSASKGAVVALTLPLARDLASWNIRVMTIAPGMMDTPMLDGIGEARREALVDLHVFPKRLGRPEDFASLVRSFVENTLLNGEVVRLDAGARLDATARLL